MTTLAGSVGAGGKNDPGDARLVQGLLNDNGAQPSLRVDGAVGPRTVAAIRSFQTRIVGLRSPDGRVDPGGRTWTKLAAREAGRPENRAARRTSPAPEERKRFQRERAAFVDPRVKETRTTTAILDALYPHFRGTRARVISGYLSDTDLFWKVNYHWDYLLDMVEHSLRLPITEGARRDLEALRSSLRSVSPDPDHGYRDSPAVGKPEDRSSYSQMTARHKVVRQNKSEFKGITSRESLISKSPRSATMFHLAAAPVAHPGTSKHGSGHALDIQGPAGSIKSICKSLGATLVFDEKSHVHVEFANGVKPAR